MGAHRLVCIQAHGDPDDGQEACHNCGNPPCVNPRHLRWDTHKSNIGDKVAHGTHNRGTRHSLAKLSDADVLAIRRLVSGGGLTQAEIGEQFGISQMQVSNIHLRKQWGWLPEVEPV